jgi:hypothetical protein
MVRPEPHFPVVDAPHYQVINRLNTLIAKGTRAIVLEAMSLKALRGPTYVLDGQPEEEAISIWCSHPPIVL